MEARRGPPSSVPGTAAGGEACSRFSPGHGTRVGVQKPWVLRDRGTTEPKPLPAPIKQEGVGAK